MSESKSCPQLVMLRIDGDVPLMDLFKGMDSVGLSLNYDGATGGLQVHRVLRAPGAGVIKFGSATSVGAPGAPSC